MESELKPCQTCTKLRLDMETISARIAAQMGGRMVCKECGREYQRATPPADKPAQKWHLGDTVAKKRGSSWRGKVVGFYSTDFTTIGYAVESHFEPGSVQVWPEVALEDWKP